MAGSVLVDSDILIEVLRNRNPEIAEIWLALASGASGVAYSAATAAEIWHGARPSEAATIDRLLSVLECVPIDAAVGRLAGEYLRRFHPSHGIELADALIGATAFLHEMRLWTRNKKHYPMRDVRFY